MTSLDFSVLTDFLTIQVVSIATPQAAPPNIMDIIAQAWGTFWKVLAAKAPHILAALVILLVGSLLARLTRSLAVYVLRFTRFEVVAEKSGIDEFLKKGDIELTLADLLAGAGYWLVVMLSILVAANSLGLVVVADLFTKVTLFIPDVMVAILILVFGAVLARFIGGLVQAFAANLGIEGSHTAGNISVTAIMVFVVFVALEQVHIGGEILKSAFNIGFGAVCAALALAFGLGGRDVAAQVIGKMYKSVDGDFGATPKK